MNRNVLLWSLVAIATAVLALAPGSSRGCKGACLRRISSETQAFETPGKDDSDGIVSTSDSAVPCCATFFAPGEPRLNSVEWAKLHPLPEH